MISGDSSQRKTKGKKRKKPNLCFPSKNEHERRLTFFTVLIATIAVAAFGAGLIVSFLIWVVSRLL